MSRLLDACEILLSLSKYICQIFCQKIYCSLAFSLLLGI